MINYTPDREQLHLNRVFFLPANAIGCLWIGLALEQLSHRTGRLAQRVGRLPLGGAAAATLGVAIVAAPLLTHYRHNDQSDNYLADDWGRNLFRSARENAIIFPSADHSSFPLIYLHVVEGVRPDVTIGDKYGYIEDRLFDEVFRGRRRPSAPVPFLGNTDEKLRYIVEHSERPVYSTIKRSLSEFRGYELAPRGLLFEYQLAGTPVNREEHDDLWKEMTFRPESLERPPGEFGFDLILADYHYAVARYHLRFRRTDEAMSALWRSAEYGYGTKEVLNNLGGTLADADHPEAAMEFLRRALEIDPNYSLAIKNLANCYFASKRYEDGMPWFKRALEIAPDHSPALLGSARAYKAAGNKTLAYLRYTKLYGLERKNRELREEILTFVKEAFGEDSPLLALENPRPQEPEMPDTPDVPTFAGPPTPGGEPGGLHTPPVFGHGSPASPVAIPGPKIPGLETP